MMNERKITAEMFRAYQKVRISGQTNMMDWQRVQAIAFHKHGVFLDRKDIEDILKRYEDYYTEFTPTYSEMIGYKP